MGEPLEQLRSKCLDGFCRLCISCEAAVSAALAPQPIDDAALRETWEWLRELLGRLRHGDAIISATGVEANLALIERALGEGQALRDRVGDDTWAAKMERRAESADTRIAELERHLRETEHVAEIESENWHQKVAELEAREAKWLELVEAGEDAGYHIVGEPKHYQATRRENELRRELGLDDG